MANIPEDDADQRMILEVYQSITDYLDKNGYHGQFKVDGNGTGRDNPIIGTVMSIEEVATKNKGALVRVEIGTNGR